MRLEISREEAQLLRSELDIRIKELRVELIHTDDRHYRKGLRQELESIEALERQVDRVLVKEKRSEIAA